jgi:hypothetical protein
MLFYDRSCNYVSGTYRKSRVDRLSTDEAQLSTTKSDGMWPIRGEGRRPGDLATLPLRCPCAKSPGGSLASLLDVWLVGASGSCLCSLYRRAWTEPSRRKQPAAVVAREAACLSWRSRHVSPLGTSPQQPCNLHLRRMYASPDMTTTPAGPREVPYKLTKRPTNCRQDNDWG